MSSKSFFSKASAVAAACIIICSTGCASSRRPDSPELLNNGQMRIAVLPVENLSGKPAARNLKEIRQLLDQGLVKQGSFVLDNGDMEKFMTRHRIRYIGGVDAQTGKAWQEETGMEAILITSLDDFDDSFPPRIALTSRLVSTGDYPRIIWMDTVALAGDDFRGVFEIGMITNIATLEEKAIAMLLDSLVGYREGVWRENDRDDGKLYRPKWFYLSPVVGRDLRESQLFFTEAGSRGSENESPARATVALSSVSSKPVTVEYAARGGSAVEGVNYVLKEGRLVFQPGETVKTVEIGIRRDGLHADDKTVEVSLRNPKGAILGETARYTYTIVNIDPEPAAAFATESLQVKEEAGSATVMIELSAVSGRDVTVPFTVGGTARAGEHYTMTPGPAVIKAGERSAPLRMDILNNGINEDDRTIVVTMGIPGNAARGKAATTTVTIADSDPAPAVSFVAKESRTDEKAGKAQVEVGLNQASGKPVTVEYRVAGGTAVPGRDYLIQGSSLTFAPGETSKTVEIEIKDRAVYKDNKTIELSLEKFTDAAPGAALKHTCTIMNSVVPPSLTFAAETGNLKSSWRTVHIPLELSVSSEKDTFVPFLVTGTLKQEAGYTVTPSPLVIKAGMKNAAITVTMEQAALAESGEIVLLLSEPVNAVLGARKTYRLNILEENPRPTVAVVPFFNRSGRRSAEEIVALRFVKQFAMRSDFDAVEPGVIRRKLLNFRLIMRDGVSLADMEAILNNVDADLILTGKVLKYEPRTGSPGGPNVDFVVTLHERRSRKVVWTSRSYTRGNDGVFFFDRGEVRMAETLAEKMIKAAVLQMIAQ